MSKQNIFDNTEFFEGYKKIRNNPHSHNNMLEKPALFSMLPNVKDLTILDLGCGYGENCRELKRLGARHVVGIDISEKMLEVANKENKSDGIEYICISMENISSLNHKYDLILSSLAIHYVQDFDKLIEDISNLLNDNGIFIFSQEHPLTTSSKSDNNWTKDESGNVLHYNLSDYGIEGKRETQWIVNGIIKYHRTFSTLLNTLITKGFRIEAVEEPIPDEKLVQEFPKFKKSYDKPDFLLIKSKKKIITNKI